MENSRAARRNVIASMFIYGTIGVFVRYIPLPSSMTAMMRGLIGAPFLLLVLLSRRSGWIGAVYGGIWACSASRGPCWG